MVVVRRAFPPQYSGVVGVHPTGGLVPWVDSRRQVAAHHVDDRADERDVRDAATVLSVIAGPDGRDLVGLPVDLPDPRSDLDRGAEGLALAWTDDFGFAMDYVVEESTRVIAHTREAALGLNRIGATVEPTDEKWEDYLHANRVHSFAGVPSMGLQSSAGVADDEWQAATDLRQRNWLRFRKLFGEYDLLLSPTIHSVAPTLDVFATRVPSGMSIRRGRPRARQLRRLHLAVQLAAVPGRVGPVRLRRRAARGYADRRTAGERPQDPPLGPRLPSGLPARPTPTGQLT